MYVRETIFLVEEDSFDKNNQSNSGGVTEGRFIE